MRIAPIERSHRSRGLLRLAFGLGTTVVAGAILAFHLQMLYARIADLANLELATAIRWILTAAVMGGILRLRKHRLSLFRGRPAMVLWVVVLLIHVQAPFDPSPLTADSAGGLPADQLLLILPVSLSLAVIGRVLFTTDPKSAREKRLGDLFLGFSGLLDLHAHLLRAGFLRLLTPRPPPA